MEVPAERREQEELELDICGPESQRGPNQDTVQLNTDPSTLTDPVQLRIKQLLNRRLFLLELQCFRKTTHSNGSSAPGELSVISEESDRLSELQAIERELEKLQPKEHQEQGQSADISQSTVKSARPCGGIYLLPQLHQEDEQLSEEPRAKTGSVVTTAAVTPVDSLGQRSAITQCPSCREVVKTGTSSSVSKATWTMCSLCCMLGCIAGCCLIPFFMKRLRSVSHQCPQCQAVIHTYKPQYFVDTA